MNYIATRLSLALDLPAILHVAEAIVRGGCLRYV